MTLSLDHASSVAGPPLWLKLIAIPVTVVVLLAGLWFFGGAVAPGYDSSIALGVAWFVAASLAIRFGLRSRPGLKRPVQLSYLATAIVVAGVFGWTTFRDETVVEDVATGVAASQAQGGSSSGGGNVQLATGSFEGLAHGASGTAAVVELASDERVLTFTGLATDNGPDLRVYLVAGPVASDDDVTDFVDLGGLKGNKGTQQYSIPPGVDTERYSTVVIWCRAFTVGFAKAALAAS
ncbi:MAG: DM13 domain-containing protein [Gaiellaceae bacterium MAG52_C11]|nr:DM13 domain-containing protein [Candidatus Gaiellasilicea maunaloa]